ncbi:MAG: chromo domain-containing protein [Nitrososphaeraceae archaeon]
MQDLAQQVEPEAQQLYEVEAIVNHGWERGKLLYEVKWKNYPTEQNTWETEGKLQKEVPDMLLEYKTRKELLKGRQR